MGRQPSQRQSSARRRTRRGPSPGKTIVTLTSVSDDNLGEELTVAWEIEPDRGIAPATKLPTVTNSNWDDPQTRRPRSRGSPARRTPRRHPSCTSAATPFPSVDALRLHWPAPSRPSGASLHAKIIVIDDALALVGSANLTSRAMESNLECGILLRGGSAPKAIRNHIITLHANHDLPSV